ncbi:hypothetical protein [Candidatus Odyssella thessalonicensis]|uniref:hypothetical protein n=1 Tax=Candidatus Odyssella thessalonicensis TaxID=84647 RepID=UPI000225B739|nr:hypothetical protein [Candidatus Odyssella thessalonicensis]
MANKFLHTAILTILSISSGIASEATAGAWKTTNLTSDEQEIVDRHLQDNPGQQFAGIQPDPVSTPGDNAKQAIFGPPDSSKEETQKYFDNLAKDSTSKKK